MKQMSLLLLSVLALSCKSTKTISDQPGSNTNTITSGSEHLYMHRWDLIEVDGKRVNAEVGKRAHLLFTAGQENTFSGYTGCNRIAGTFELTGKDVIKFIMTATTKMLCSDDRQIESIILKAVDNTHKWRISDNILSFRNNDSIILKFSAVDAALASKLEGVWEMNYISGLRIAFEGLYPGKKPSISFDLATGEISGNTSCNAFSAPFKMDGMNIKFGDGRSTLMACEGNGERTFLDMLKKVDGYSLSDDNKTINFLTGDVAVMRFVKK